MKDLILVGAGGYAREIYELVIKPINRDTKAYNVLGVIDDNIHALDGKKTDLKHLGTISDWRVIGDERYVMSIASPQIKENVARVMYNKGAVFESIIHPAVTICSGAQYGEGLVAYRGAVLGPDVSLGSFVTLLGTGIGHDVSIGDYCTISSYCGVNGNVKLGKRVFIGSHATIAPGIRVEDDVFIGIGSVVISHIKAGVHVFGNPAHKIDF